MKGEGREDMGARRINREGPRENLGGSRGWGCSRGGGPQSLSWREGLRMDAAKGKGRWYLYSQLRRNVFPPHPTIIVSFFNVYFYLFIWLPPVLVVAWALLAVAFGI